MTQALVYSTSKKLWTEWPRLSVGVRGQSCVRLGDEILMAGGWSSGQSKRTVLFDIKTGSAREVASLKYPRYMAAMEVIGGRAVILGDVSGSVRRTDGEMWNVDTETWEETDISLNIGRTFFSLVATDEKMKCD